MHWFYASLLIQHFLNSLIAGSIGFWEVGRALWYLVTLPMAPIIVFFYQLYIHSWIRSHGPRNAEYIVVEFQIILATTISMLATIFWSIGYVIPYISQYQSNNSTKEPTTLTLGSGSSGTKITDLKVWSTTETEKSLTIQSTTSATAVPVTIKSITVNLSQGDPVTVYPEGTLSGTAEDKKPVKAKVEATKSGTGSVTLTLTTYKKTEQGGEAVPAGTPEILATRAVSGAQVNITSLYLALDPANVDVKKLTGNGRTEASATETTVTGYTYSPYPNNYYFSGITGESALWNEKWDGGKCFYAEYYNSTGNGTHALLKLCILGNTLKMKYYGKDTGDWKKIDADKFSECVDQLQRTGQLSDTSLGQADSDPGDNFKYSMIFGLPNDPTATWYPLIMQGLSVGAVGSIFPNLIPKTLTCPKTTRTLTVINMFMVPVPHIFNVMLGDMDLLGRIGVGDDWTKSPCWLWPYSLLLYLIYILAILFAIFNIHYPEWALSSFLRNNTWMVFLMILFTDVLNETFNAISRAGICSQKSADTNKPKNHPCLHNKIACLMNLTYIPFWMTTVLYTVLLKVTLAME